MRYVIADKYGVEGLKDAAWHLIELTLALIRVGAESFEDDQPYRAEEVTRNLCEGFFLGTPTLMDTFKADSEQGIVDLLDYVCDGWDMIPDTLQHCIGKELHRTMASSSWKCPRIQRKLAQCPLVVEGFIQRTLEASRYTYIVLQKAGFVK
jgi:hypothetical protein